MNIPYSPVRIFNIFIDEVEELPNVEFTACLIGPVLPLVNRELKEENTYKDDTNNYYLNFEYKDNEYPVNYNFYISPKTKRQYVKPFYKIYTYYKGREVVLRKDIDYQVEQENNRFKLLNIINISGDIFFKLYLGNIKLIKLEENASEVILKSASSNLITDYQFLIENDFLLELKDSNVVLKVINILNHNTLVANIINGTVPDENIYEVYKLYPLTINGNQFSINNLKLYMIYRVFRSIYDEEGKPKIILIDNTIKLKNILGGDIVYDLDNLLFTGGNILLKNMKQRKAFYVIPIKEQGENGYLEALNKIIELTFENVIPYEITVLTMNEEIIESLINFIETQNEPKYSNPIRCFISIDLPLYDFEWEKNTISEEGYVYFNKVSGEYSFDTPIITITDVVKIKYNNGTDPTLGEEWVVFTNNTEDFYVIVQRNKVNLDTANNTITFKLTDISYFVGNFSYNLLKTITKMFPDCIISNNHDASQTFLRSLQPLSLPNIVSYWTSYANNERVNIVNPWLITYDKKRLPGFYLSCARIGQNVGEPIISKPTSGEPINLKDIVERPDYSIEIFGPDYFEQLIDGGIDVCLLYEGIIQSWHQRTSYKGLQIDKKYQNTIKALDYFNWRQKKIALRYTRKYALSSQIINRLRTELELNLEILKGDNRIGPVLGPNSKIERIIIVKSPNDIPPDIPVSMEVGIIIVNKVELLRPWLLTVIYNTITAQ